MKKTVLITGGATGIGRAISLRFAGQGYAVIIHYNTSKKQAEALRKEIEADKGEAFLLKSDLTDKKQAARMFKAVAKKYKRLDILINNAGWTRYVPARGMGLISESLYKKIMDSNFKSAFFCCQLAEKLLKRSRQARVINIVSDSAYSGRGSNIIYCAAKAALVNLTKSLSLAWDKQVKVFAVAPGYVDTGFLRSFPAALIAEYKKQGMLKAERIAQEVLGLCLNPKARTGQVLLIGRKPGKILR